MPPRVAGNGALARLLDAPAPTADGDRPQLAAADLGTSLPVDVRGRLEHAFGVPLDHVRLHRGPDAARTAAALDARAFTVGEHIGFPSRLPLYSAEGERLLAHEVAHVVQQGPAAGHAGTPRRTSHGDGTERSAELAADLAVNGRQAGPLIAAPGLVVARAGTFGPWEWIDQLGEKAKGVKNSAYDWLIERLRELHRSGIARLTSYGANLTGAQRRLWDALVMDVDTTLSFMEGVVYGVVGTAAGFVTGILQMVVGLLRMLVGAVEGILRFLYGFIDGGRAYDEWAAGVARTISLIPEGLRKLVDDWRAEFWKASPEKQALMIGELGGQILAFLATLGVAAGKAGSVAQSAKLAPKLAALIETAPQTLATTVGTTAPVALEVAPATAKAVATAVVKHGAAATEAVGVTGLQTAARGGGPAPQASDLPHYKSKAAFMEATRRRLLALREARTPSRLDFLLGPDGQWHKGTFVSRSGRTMRGRYALSDPDQKIVHAGHMQSDWYAKAMSRRDYLMLEDADLNWMSGASEAAGSVTSKPAVLIDGFPVDIPTARLWEAHPKGLPKGTVAAAPIIQAPAF